MKIALCGGHITPALALIDFVQTNHPEDQLVLLGRTYAQSNKGQVAHEKELALHRGIAFIPFEGVKWGAQSGLSKITVIFSVFLAFFKALLVLLKLRPAVLVSFGGYLAVPLSYAAWVLRIPVVTHEQTYCAGVANQWIGKIATAIALSHDSSRESFPARKTTVVGNLLRAGLFQPNPPKPAWVKRKGTRPIIYITGGSQGSEVINSVVQQALPKLLKQYRVIHQCGKETTVRSYLQELQAAAAKLGSLADRYWVQEWYSENELAWILQHTTVAVSRAGANTVDELSACQVPTIYIPLPYARDEEQKKNTQAAVSAGGAVLLEQKDLNAHTLLSQIEQTERMADTMRSQLSIFAYQSNAPKSFYRLIQQSLRTSASAITP